MRGGERDSGREGGSVGGGEGERGGISRGGSSCGVNTVLPVVFVRKCLGFCRTL